eukprot:Opistho-2@68606
MSLRMGVIAAVLCLAACASLSAAETCSSKAMKHNLYNCAFVSVDANRDKKLGLNEMNAAIEKHANMIEAVAISMFKSKIDESFHWCDKSKDFALSLEELLDSSCFSFVPCDVWRKVEERLCPRRKLERSEL